MAAPGNGPTRRTRPSSSGLTSARLRGTKRALTRPPGVCATASAQRRRRQWRVTADVLGRTATWTESSNCYSMESASQPPFDVAIVGGGPAGLAAALILGRMRRRVLLLDADDPANGVSEGVHGLFGHDGTPPLELRRTAQDQLRPYESVTVRMVAAENVRPTSRGFDVLAGDAVSEAGVLLLCTGMG